jgi:hypothetical protein
MARRTRWAATASLVAGAAASAIVGAPVASASGADTAIADLEAQGYIVNVNYLNGQAKALSQCTVTNVNNPSSSPAPGDTIYVDVRCPNHDDDDGGSFGIGVGIG